MTNPKPSVTATVKAESKEGINLDVILRKMDELEKSDALFVKEQSGKTLTAEEKALRASAFKATTASEVLGKRLHARYKDYTRRVESFRNYEERIYAEVGKENPWESLEPVSKESFIRFLNQLTIEPKTISLFDTVLSIEDAFEEVFSRTKANYRKEYADMFEKTYTSRWDDIDLI